MKYDNVKQNTVYCYYNIKVLLSQFRNRISMSLTLITWTGLEIVYVQSASTFSPWCYVQYSYNDRSKKRKKWNT